MKPLGIYLAITSAENAEAGLIDDDYRWHLRQAAQQTAAAATRPPRAPSFAERLAALVRLPRTQSGEPTARRA